MAISTIHFLVTWDAVALLSNGDNHFVDLLLQSLKFSLSTNNNFPPFIAFLSETKGRMLERNREKIYKMMKRKKSEFFIFQWRNKMK